MGSWLRSLVGKNILCDVEKVMCMDLEGTTAAYKIQ